MRGAVASLFRCGTTATMRAFEAGGLHVVRSTEKDNFVRHHHYEPSVQQMSDGRFPLGEPDESVVKVLWPGLAPSMSSMCYALHPDQANGYRVLFIWRHPIEIRRSLESQSDRVWPDRVVNLTCPWVTRDEGRNYAHVMEAMKAHYLNRRDVYAFYEIQYRSSYRPDLPSLEHDADQIFHDLARQGWPLDPVKAAAVIDVGVSKFRSEELLADGWPVDAVA